MKNRVLYHTLVCVVILSACAFGQGDDLETTRAIWRTRADYISDQMVKKSFGSDDLEKAEMFADLGKLWFPTDQAKAGTFIEDSVDVLFLMSSEEINNDVPKYLGTLRYVLISIGNLAPKQTKRLLSILADSEKIPKKNSGLSADTLIKFALSIVKDDPKMAADLGIMAFSMGQPSEFYTLYWELRRANGTLADRFFDTAIRSARSDPNIAIGLNLKNAVFPEFIFPNPSAAIQSSDLQRTTVLNLLADLLFNASSRYERGEISSCSTEATLIAPLRSKFGTSLPQRSTIVERSLAICLPRNTPENGDKESPANAASVEEFLKLADEAKTLDKRSYYLFRAVSLANDKERFDLAIDILEKMKKEERDTDIQFWESLRYTAASGSAYLNLVENNPAGAIETLEKVPVDIRAFAKVGFALKCPADKTEIRDFCLAQIDGANKDFPQSKKPISEKFSTWLQVIKIYSRFSRYSDAADTFDKIVKELNQDTEDDKKPSDFHLATDRFSAVITSGLLDSADQSLIESVNRISDNRSRINAGLALLAVTMKRLKELSIPRSI